MFEFDFLNCDTKSDTMDMLLERDGFNIESTPTNDSHVNFLRKLKIVIGLTLNSNLYSKKEEKEEDVEEDELDFMSFNKKL